MKKQEQNYKSFVIVAILMVFVANWCHTSHEWMFRNEDALLESHYSSFITSTKKSLAEIGFQTRKEGFLQKDVQFKQNKVGEEDFVTSLVERGGNISLLTVGYEGKNKDSLINVFDWLVGKFGNKYRFVDMVESREAKKYDAGDALIVQSLVENAGLLWKTDDCIIVLLFSESKNERYSFTLRFVKNHSHERYEKLIFLSETNEIPERLLNFDERLSSRLDHHVQEN
ncbi:MAG: hypothetical protein ACOX5R_20490 [bacterium]|jgi:hypothetical protein